MPNAAPHESKVEDYEELLEDEGSVFMDMDVFFADEPINQEEFNFENLYEWFCCLLKFCVLI